MSLLEDVLDVLRIVLEYFGVSPDMVNTHTHTHTSVIIILLNLKPASRDINVLTNGIS